MEVDRSLVTPSRIHPPDPNMRYPEAHLLSLPAELSNMIWSYLAELVSSEYEELWNTKIKPSLNLGFSLACRQLYHQAHFQIYYSINWPFYILSAIREDVLFRPEQLLSPFIYHLKDYLREHYGMQSTLSLESESKIERLFLSQKLSAVTALHVSPEFNELLEGIEMCRKGMPPPLCGMLEMMPNLTHIRYTRKWKNVWYRKDGIHDELANTHSYIRTLPLTLWRFGIIESHWYHTAIQIRWPEYNSEKNRSDRWWEVLAAVGPDSLDIGTEVPLDGRTLAMDSFRYHPEWKELSHEPLYNLHVKDPDGNERKIFIFVEFTSTLPEDEVTFMRWSPYGNQLEFLDPETLKT